VGVDLEDAALLAKQKINGKSLATMTYERFREYGIPGGPAAELFEGVKKVFPERFGPPAAAATDAPAAPTGEHFLLWSLFPAFILRVIISFH